MNNLKIGDRLRMKNSNNVYTLVYTMDSEQVWFMNENNVCCVPFKVKDPDNITPDEFLTTGYSIAYWESADGSPIYPATNTTYSVGQKFQQFQSGAYILAQVDTRKVCLISLENGNRYDDPVEVNDPSRITPFEFDKITGYSIHDFVLIK